MRFRKGSPARRGYHSFLLLPGTWLAEGEFCDPAGTVAAVRGAATVAHEGRTWRIAGKMRLAGGTTLEIVYEVEPLLRGRRTTRWSSRNPALGLLEGEFVFFGDAILSRYRSADGRYDGAEVLIRQDEDRYLARGTLWGDGRWMSAWSTRLKRKR